MTEIALRLASRGTLEKEIDEICRHFVGRRPPHDAWLEEWPPTLEQLCARHVTAHDGDDSDAAVEADRVVKIAVDGAGRVSVV